MNKKVMLIIPILIGIMFVLPLIMAVSTVSMTIKDYSNLTKSLSTVVSVSGTDNVTNITCFYNATGGAQYPALNTTYWASAINTSQGQSTFTLTGTYVGSDTNKNVNITCAIFNATTGGTLQLPAGNGTVSAQNVTIDSANPITTLQLDIANIGTRDPILVKWSAVDSGSKLATFSINVTTPDSNRCPPVNITNSSDLTAGVTGSTLTGQYQVLGDQNACGGTYTVTLTATDFSGNSGALTKTYRVSLSGLKSGSNTLGGVSQSTLASNQANKNLILGDTGTSIAIILIIGAAAYLFFKRKK